MLLETDHHRVIRARQAGSAIAAALKAGHAEGPEALRTLLQRARLLATGTPDPLVTIMAQQVVAEVERLLTAASR